MHRFSQKRFSNIEREALKQKVINNKESIILTFVGRITPDKGVYELLHAFKLLRENEYLVDLLLVGPLDVDKDKKSSELRTQIQQSPNVHWVDYTDKPENYLAFTNILCLPSYREGFGTVVIEAAAMEIPTVGTNIYGLSDAIIDNVTGLLVPVSNSNALFMAIKKLLDSPDDRKKMGAAAKQRCIESFDSEKVNHEILKDYLRFAEIYASK